MRAATRTLAVPALLVGTAADPTRAAVFPSGTIIVSNDFENQTSDNAPDYDGNKATFAIDNLKMAVPVPVPKSTVICVK